MLYLLRASEMELNDMSWNDWKGKSIIFRDFGIPARQLILIHPLNINFEVPILTNRTIKQNSSSKYVIPYEIILLLGRLLIIDQQ